MAVEEVIREAYGQVAVTLGGTAVDYAPGALIGWDGSAWVKADADAATPIVARLKLLHGAKSGDVAAGCKRGVAVDTDLSLTVDGVLYTSGTVGAVTQTVPTPAAAVVQRIGRALSATEYEFDIAPPRYVHVVLTLPVVLPLGTGAEDQVANVTPGFRGRIEDWEYVATVVATGAGATRTFNLEINAVDVTGTATAIALAEADGLGEVKALGAATAARDFDADDTIAVEVASGGTAFTAGSGYFLIRCRQEVEES